MSSEADHDSRRSMARGPSACIRASRAFVEFPVADTEQSIAARFASVVARHGAELAVKDTRRGLTYDELNRCANRIGHALLARSRDVERPVALLLGHGVETVAAILGVLKTGRAYVPLDPGFPQARNAFVLEDSGCATVITDDRNLSLARDLVGDHAIDVISIDRIEPGVADHEVPVRVAPGALAYILYTSGSTGQPKGVQQNHRNTLRVVRRFTNGLRISREDRLLFLVSFSVTASVATLLGGILNGASVFLYNVKEEGVGRLADWMADNAITVYRSVPSVFHHFVATLPNSSALPRLRIIRLGGDRITRSDFELYRRHFADDCVFVNGYGTSEMPNLFQCSLDKWSEFEGDLVPVGWPLDETEFTLCDDAGQEGPGVMSGEIIIRSPFLSPGYWRRPELNDAAFAVDEGGGGLRRYRTGDTGTLQPDGALVHTGRKDFQTKIRGFRVELGEIERALCAVPPVDAAVVVAHKDHHDENQLVAYVVAAAGQPLQVAEVRRQLAARVPDYMVPAHVVQLDRLPLTPNGKIDRGALPAPNDFDLATATNFVAPASPVETVVARIWSDVLGLERVGLHNDFFELGGNSLSANSVVSRLRDKLGVDTSLRSFLEAPTVAEFVADLLQDPARRVRLEQIAELVLAMDADDTASRGARATT